MRGISFCVVRLADEEPDVARSWSKIQDKLAEVASELPTTVKAPTLAAEERWNSNTMLVAIVARNDSNGEEFAARVGVLSRWGRELESRMRFVPGTRFSELHGEPENEILVEISPERLASAKLTIGELADAVHRFDSAASEATSRSPTFQVPIRSSGDTERMNQLRRLVLKDVGQAHQLRLIDVAKVSRRERRPPQSMAIVKGSRAVVVGVTMDLDGDIDTWTTRQSETLEEFATELPSGLVTVTLFSQQRYTDIRSRRLYESLGLGLLLVIVIVWGMMGWRAAIPICCALPLTLLGVFALMIPFGMTLQQMSIAGLILALGMLIDNPIIIVDEITYLCSSGKSPETAMNQAVKELTRPLVGSNVTTMLGFSPMLFVPGPTGEFLYSLVWAVIASLFVSLALALTVIPVLAAWSLASFGSGTIEGTVRDSGFWSRTYQSILGRLFGWPFIVVAISLVLPIIGFSLSSELKEQFFPASERDHFSFTIRMPSNVSIEQTERVARRAREIVLNHEQVDEVTLFVGTNSPMMHYSMLMTDENRPEFAHGIVHLKGEQADAKLVRELQDELDEALPSAQVIVSLIMQGPATIAPIEFRLYGPSLDQLSDLGIQAKAILMTVPGVVHAHSTLDLGGPELLINVNQQEAAAAHISNESIGSQLQDQLNGRVPAFMSEENVEIPIRVCLDDAHRINGQQTLSLPMISETGQVVPLGSVADFQIDQRVFTIHRRNSARCNTIRGYTSVDSLPIVLEQKFREQMNRQGFDLPAGYRVDFGGVSRERDSAIGNLMAYASIILMLMGSVLVMTFRSFRCAAIVSLVGALSVGLGLLSLWAFGFPIGLMAVIGLLGMMGLAINDSIVVLSVCRTRASNQSIETAVAGSTRHVITTSLTTIGGVMPLILAGGDFWPPMMIVTAGGVAGATLLSLGFTPAMSRILFRYA